MDATAIVVIALCVAFIIGGLILAASGDRQSSKIHMQERHDPANDNKKPESQKDSKISGRRK